MLATDQPSLFVERRGSGARIVVLGGGPGFSHDYLSSALQPLEHYFELIYVDYPGCGRSKSHDAVVSAADTVSLTLNSILAVCGSQPVDVICHSFGSYIVGASLSAECKINVRKCVFVCPTPHSIGLCQLAEAKFITRLSAEDLEFVQFSLAHGVENPMGFIARLLPYYCGRNVNIPIINVDFNRDVYLSVRETLGSFDFSAEIKNIENKLYIFGEADFITPEMFSFDENSTVKLLHGGHFMFYDDNSRFTNIVREFLTGVSPQSGAGLS